MKEGDSRDGSYLRGKSYYPYYGRGLIQLTWEDTYIDYGKHKGFPRTEHHPSIYKNAGWNPDILLVKNNTEYNEKNCTDSAGFYIARKEKMLQKMDHGTSTEDAIAVSRCVNGNVDIERLNGLDARLQSIRCIRDVLLDMPADATTESLSFSWRRNSQPELTASGKKKFILRTPDWIIDVLLDKQRP